MAYAFPFVAHHLLKKIEQLNSKNEKQIIKEYFDVNTVQNYC